MKPLIARLEKSGNARYHRNISRTTPLPMVIRFSSSQNLGSLGNTPLYVPSEDPPGMVCTSTTTCSPASAKMRTYRLSEARDTVTCFTFACAGSVTIVSAASGSDANAAQVNGSRTFP